MRWQRTRKMRCLLKSMTGPSNQSNDAHFTNPHPIIMLEIGDFDAPNQQPHHRACFPCFPLRRPAFVLTRAKMHGDDSQPLSIHDADSALLCLCAWFFSLVLLRFRWEHVVHLNCGALFDHGGTELDWEYCIGALDAGCWIMGISYWTIDTMK